MGRNAHPRYRWVPPAELINAAACNAAITSSTIDVSSYDRMTLFLHYTRSAGTGNMDLKVEGYDETVSEWVTLCAVATAAGVSTLTAETLRIATASASFRLEARYKDMTFRKVRVSMAAAVTSATASDLLSVSALLAYYGD